MSNILSPSQKASALLISIGPERAAKIIRHLSEADVERLSLEISKLRRVDTNEMDTIVDDFYGMYLTQKVITEGGVIQAKEILEKAFGPQLASSYLDRVSRSMRVKIFDFIRKVDYKNLVMVLQNEHPQTIALVLAYAGANQSSMVLSDLHKDMRVEVVERIAKLDNPHPEFLKVLEKVLESKLSTMITLEVQEIGGVHHAADIMNRVERGIEKYVFDELSMKNPGLVQQIREKMFVFEDILNIDDDSIQLFIREVDAKDLAVALKVANAELLDAFFRNMSTRMQETIKSDMEYLKHIRMSDVEKAQQRIVAIVRRLEEEGQLVISKGGLDDVFV
mgnify:CR=1 FL=1